MKMKCIILVDVPKVTTEVGGRNCFLIVQFILYLKVDRGIVKIMTLQIQE